MSYTVTKQRRSLYLTRTIALLLLTPTFLSSALATQEETKWYEVNIVIFKQNTPGFQSEQWRTRDQLSLSFPNRTAVLDDESYEQVDFSAIELEPYTPYVYTSDIDAESLESEGYPINTPSSALSIKETISNEKQPGTNTTTEITPTLLNSSAENPPPDIMAFRSISTTDEEFTQSVRRLNNSRAYKILVQKTWRQPGLSTDHSVPILIQGGEQFDENYELEGTIEISLSRYLHVKSNLWLSEYVKQVELVNAWWEEPSTGTPETSGNQEASPAPSNDSSEIDSLSNRSSASTDVTALPLKSGLNTIPLSELGNQETITYYEATRTVLLNESRRMRSDELHYLDHPLFGMLVKVTSYEAPEPEEETTEDEANQDPTGVQ